MGKRITQRARGKGSLTFRVNPKAYRYRIRYPKLKTSGKARIIRLLNSSAHSCPLAEIKIGEEKFFSPAASGVYEGQEIVINDERADKKPQIGDILKIKDIPVGTQVFNLESIPGKGGKYLRSSGCFGLITNKNEKGVEILINKRRILLHENCRAAIGVAAGEGRLIKPFVKAGNKHYLMKSKGRKWHRTSPVKVNAVDHPFGGGRGKRIKSKIAKRNAPPGKKVGHIRPSRTGRRK